MPARGAAEPCGAQPRPVAFPTPGVAAVRTVKGALFLPDVDMIALDSAFWRT